MVWLRSHRRELSLVAAYVLMLQSILLALASGVRAERAGLELDPGAAVICTAHGMQLITDGTTPQPTPSRSDCPCCTLGAACGVILGPFAIVLGIVQPPPRRDVHPSLLLEVAARHDLWPAPYPVRGPPPMAA